MSKPHELRAYQYVNRPYAVVRDALRADLAGILGRATHSAAGRAGTLVAGLRIEVGSLEVGTDIAIEPAAIEERTQAGHAPSTHVSLRWKAARGASLFPSMEADLAIYPLSKDETQIDLHGLYRPPLGALGSAVDSLVGHRIAEASIHRFVEDIASFLRSELPQP